MNVLYFIQFSLLLLQMQLMFLKSYFNFKLKNCHPLKSVSKKIKFGMTGEVGAPTAKMPFHPTQPSVQTNIYAHWGQMPHQRLA